MQINLYPHILESEKFEGQPTIADFMQYVKFGKWKAITEKVKKEKDKAKRQELKKKVPYVTVSGTFEPRRVKTMLKTHSGFICMDFDDLGEDTSHYFKLLSEDPYSYGVARSISALGLFCIVPIDGSKHEEAFIALEQYYLNKYGLIADTKCKDTTRPRFVSYDEEAFINPKAKTFKNYLPKKALQKMPDVVYCDSDIKGILDQVQQNRIDLTHSDYGRYLNLAFALQSEYGEEGRSYFHTLCCNSEKYNERNCNKQFDYALRSNKTGVSIKTLFYYAKEAGLTVTTEKTTYIATIAQQAKKAGKDIENTRKVLATENLSGDNVNQVLEQIYQGRTVKTSDASTLLGQLEIFLHMNYRLKRNEITRNVENGGEVLETKDLNTIYIQSKKAVDEKVSYQDLERLINSDFIEDYNPLLNFFESHRGKHATGLIKQLADSIESPTGFGAAAFDPAYKEYFITKWLVGMVASVHGHHSPLLLALTGGQNTGKTFWFRNLLPAELKKYYAESKLDNGKDDYILMCQKLLILDDELAGKSKKDEKLLKEITSKETFSLREPYGRKNVDLKRLAVLAGTSNEQDLLSDPTGNRRIIPIAVTSINHQAYNSIDKTDLLLEAYHLYQAGYTWDLNKEDIARLNGATIEFEQVSLEGELLTTHFKALEADATSGIMTGNVEYLTTSQIKAAIEQATAQRLNIRRLGIELRRLNYKRVSKKVNGLPAYCYVVSRTGGNPIFDKETSEASSPAFEL